MPALKQHDLKFLLAVVLLLGLLALSVWSQAAELPEPTVKTVQVVQGVILGLLVLLMVLSFLPPRKRRPAPSPPRERSLGRKPDRKT